MIHPRLMIFDMDGLLFDSERSYMHEIAKAMAEYGYTLTEENYKRVVGRRFPDTEQIMKSIYGEQLSYLAVIRKARPRMLEMAAEGRLAVKPGIRELLCYLKELDIPCVVASSSYEETVKVYLQGTGLSDYFSFIIGGDQVRKGKPDPEVFLKCCEAAGVSPEQAMVFEDSEYGVRAALAAGIPVICIPDMVEPSEELVPQLFALCRDGLEAKEFLRRNLSGYSEAKCE